jgi:signal transduction histidine kinase
MRERAALLGGRLRIESTSASGTTVHTQIPLHAPGDDEI